MQYIIKPHTKDAINHKFLLSVDNNQPVLSSVTRLEQNPIVWNIAFNFFQSGYYIINNTLSTILDIDTAHQVVLTEPTQQEDKISWRIYNAQVNPPVFNIICTLSDIDWYLSVDRCEEGDKVVLQRDEPINWCFEPIDSTVIDSLYAPYVHLITFNENIEQHVAIDRSRLGNPVVVKQEDPRDSTQLWAPMMVFYKNKSTILFFNKGTKQVLKRRDGNCDFPYYMTHWNSNNSAYCFIIKEKENVIAERKYAICHADGEDEVFAALTTEDRNVGIKTAAFNPAVSFMWHANFVSFHKVHYVPISLRLEQLVKENLLLEADLEQKDREMAQQEVAMQELQRKVESQERMQKMADEIQILREQLQQKSEQLIAKNEQLHKRRRSSVYQTPSLTQKKGDSKDDSLEGQSSEQVQRFKRL